MGLEMEDRITMNLEQLQKEASDSISMLRYYCELKEWNFEELIKLGE